MPPGRRCEPFDHPEWIYELEHDKFRALLSMGVGHPEFISRKANVIARFANLALLIDRKFDVHVVLDGEIEISWPRPRDFSRPRSSPPLPNW